MEAELGKDTDTAKDKKIEDAVKAFAGFPSMNYNSFLWAGFTEEQALMLTLNVEQTMLQGKVKAADKE
jgi:hypothetical protein